MATEETFSPKLIAAFLDAIDLLTDEFFSDVARSLGGEDFAQLTMAGYLPRKHLPAYTPLFAKQFLTCLITVAWKLRAPGHYRLSCVAEELAFRALVQRAKDLLDSEDDVSQLDKFADTVFEDRGTSRCSSTPGLTASRMRPESMISA